MKFLLQVSQVKVPTVKGTPWTRLIDIEPELISEMLSSRLQVLGQMR